MHDIPQQLTPLQLELLKIYSFQPSEADLIAIKKMLAAYFAQKLIQQVDEAVEKKGITGDDLKSWLNEKA